MEYRILGKTGLEVSSVGVGCWQMGGLVGESGWTGTTDEESIATIELPPLIRDGDVMMWLNCAVSLAPEGSDLFGSTYPSGELMAPLTLRVPGTIGMPEG